MWPVDALELANSFRGVRGRPVDALDPALGLHELRDTIRGLFGAAAGGTRPDSAAIARLNRLARAPKLDWQRGKPRLANEDAKVEAARTAIELLASGRVRRCGNPRCILFLAGDGRRIFCSEGCANRTRVARHAARR